MSGIGIEMCINEGLDFDKAVHNTAKLMASLCFTYDWEPRTAIRTHQDCDGKHCPNQILNGRNGWSVEKVKELTVDYLLEIQDKTPQGARFTQSETEKAVKTTQVMPDYFAWSKWHGNEGKSRAEYSKFRNELLRNSIDQKELWFAIAESVMEHFGPNLKTAADEIENIYYRKVPYKKLTGDINMEREYLQDRDLGLLSFTTSDAYYEIQRGNSMMVGFLKNGREVTRKRRYRGNPQDIDVMYDLKEDPLQRIMLYVKAMIRVQSGGQLVVDGQPILRDKNNEGVYTRGGLLGAKLTSVSKETATRLMWDWRYNLDHVLRQMGGVYKDAKNSPYNDIKYSAIDWAIASHSWDELPDALYQMVPNTGSYKGYMNGEVCPTRNTLWQSVDSQFNSMASAGTSSDRAPLLYADITGAPIPEIHLMYTGLENDELSREPDPLDDYPDHKYLPGEQGDAANKRLEAIRDYARKLAEDKLRTMQITEDELESEIEKIYQRELEKLNDLNPDSVLTDEEMEENLRNIANNSESITLRYSDASPLDAVYDMYTDTLSYNQTGRLLRAFPTYVVQLVDEGKWFSRFKTWDNFYGYNALHSIDVYKSRKIVADTAIVKMSNMYGGLTSKREDMGYDDLEKPSFFSSQFWKHYVQGIPKEEVFDQRENLAQTLSLKAGARLHIRMGYGADPFGLPIVFNGVISEVDTGEVVTVVAQGDGIELTNAISGSENETSHNIFHETIAPRDVIGKIMTSKGNWIKDTLNNVSNAYLFKEPPSGIAHFGSSIYTEDANTNFFNDDYGEAMVNVYTNDGSGRKTMFHDDMHHLVGKIDHALTSRPMAPSGRNVSGIRNQDVPDIDGQPSEDVDTDTGERNEDLSNYQYADDEATVAFFEEGGAFDEKNILVSLYGNTLWDIVQTFAMCSPDYHAAVVPFEYRSTLFFGQLHWPLVYAVDTEFYADSQTGEWIREVKPDGWLTKTFMQAHVVTSDYNLISNNVKASSEGVYNNVVVSYDGHQTPIIQADADIRYDQQRTAFIEGTVLTRHDRRIGDSVRNFFTTEVQAMIYGHSTVRDFMKDMYKGSYIMLGEGSVKPHDLMYMSDSVQDMEGIHNVKAVHHSMNMQEGFLTTIEPDAYVVNFDAVGLYVGMMAWTIGKNTAMRLKFTKARPNSTHTPEGVNSSYLSSTVLDKLMFILSNAESFPFASRYPGSYIAAVMRKSFGLYFEEIGRLLSIDFVLERANRMFNTNSELSVDHVSSLSYYLANYGPSRYSPEIRQSIAQNEEIRKANEKFRSNQKAFFNGVDMAEAVQVMAEEAARAAAIFEEFWTNYLASEYSGYISVDDLFARELEEYAAQYNVNISDIPKDIRDELLGRAQDNFALGTDYIPSQSQGLVGAAQDVFHVGGTLVNWVVDGTWGLARLPFIAAVATISRWWDSKKQNAECVKVIPMNYKGSEFLAAMSGHRGGVWGDTPSEWDRWFDATWDSDMALHKKIIPAIMNSFSDFVD